MSALAPLKELPSPFLASPAWLAAHLDDPRVRVLDATTHLVPRSDKPYDVLPGRLDFERSHIPGARFVDMDGELSDPEHDLHFMVPPTQHFNRSLGQQGIGNDALIVAYSTANHWWAARLWWLLRLFGHDAVAVLDGGFQEWTRLGLPVESGRARARPQATFQARREPTGVAARGDVLQALGRQDTCVLNALRPEQHAGTGGTQYGRPGHISGSVNIPSANVVDANNRFRPADELHAIFAPALARPRVIAYCGGGIAAASSVFCLQMLGHGDVRLYDGSLSEWAPDASLPMETL